MNKWLDEENRVYIIFTVEEDVETLGRSNKAAVKILNELDSTSGGAGILVSCGSSVSLPSKQNRYFMRKVGTKKDKNLPHR